MASSSFYDFLNIKSTDVFKSPHHNCLEVQPRKSFVKTTHFMDSLGHSFFPFLFQKKRAAHGRCSS